MSTAVARGPLQLLLQSTSGQYIVLGAGVYTLFPEQVQKVLTSLVMQYPQLTAQANVAAQNGMIPHQPVITIQAPQPTIVHSSKGEYGVVTYAIVGAGVCWVGYVACTELLPEAVAQMLPVTQRLFKKTAETLGRGILNVKEVLEEKILNVSEKQDELGEKQDKTNKAVEDIQKELGEARIDLGALQDCLERCEGSLESSNDMQGYTLKGVKLLVRCVTSFMPDDGHMLVDIAKYIQEGAEIDKKNKDNGSGESPKPSSPSTPKLTEKPSQPKIEILPAVSPEPVAPHPRYDMKELHALLGH